MINNPIICKFFKDFADQKKKTNNVVVLSCICSPNIVKYREYQRDLPKIWKTRLLQTHIEEFICINVQAHSSLEPPLEYNQDQMPLMNLCSLWPFRPSSGFSIVGWGWGRGRKNGRMGGGAPFNLLVQVKKVILSMSYGSSTSSW